MYWKIYSHIESEVYSLSYSISLDEVHKNVYSPQIAELQLRVYTLLESLVKRKYLECGGKDKKIKYDDKKCVSLISKTDNYKNKIVITDWYDYKFDKKIFKPFEKNEERVKKENFTNVGKAGNANYAWNNAYQSLRHNLEEALPHYGTLYYLFEGLSALRLLLSPPYAYGREIFSVVELREDGKTVTSYSSGQIGILQGAGYIVSSIPEGWQE